MNQTTDTQTAAASSPISVAARPFGPNIEGAIARLHLSSGPVLFCDVLILTERDLVVTIPKSEAIPERGQKLKCSLFLIDDDSYVSHREGVVHWEMGLHGQRLAGIFLTKSAPSDLLTLTEDDRRQEVRYPANLACGVQDKTDTRTGRLVNYSLNGLATQLPKPLEIGENYTVQVEAGDDTVELHATCRWSIETSYGFVNGCSLKAGEGERLAKREFRGTVMPWDINRTRSQPGRFKLEAEQEDAASTNAANDGKSNETLLSRTTILLLSAVVLAFSVKMGESLLKETTFLCGCVGLLTYIGLSWTGRVREASRVRRESEQKRKTAETRLEAHVQTGASLVRPNSEDE